MPPLSDHLFWDVDRATVDPGHHAPWLVKRVLEQGRWRDWQALVAFYGKPRLEEIVTGLRSLEPRAFAFCRVWFDRPASSFRCSASTPFPHQSASC
ncbi:DUF6922 domain-containing protein [Luteolibacter soli]|uniref:DUF6922 domain-containing protein n=1 Tax=Luteolibacter soli TaxID=3135280 RepID=A0ABU9AVB0_9BACT